MENETWKPVTGYEGLYEVSSLGRIRALFYACNNQLKPGRVLKSHAHKNQYLFVTLYKNKIGTAVSVHSVLLKAFKGPRPESNQARHLDGNRTNNTVENLEWGTISENREDSRRHGTITNGERNGFSKLTRGDVLRIRILRDAGESCVGIAKMFGVHTSTVWLIGKRKIWNHVS